jgi:hypothetical protein
MSSIPPVDPRREQQLVLTFGSGVDSKSCAWCGKEFFRRKGVWIGTWEKIRFCSSVCGTRRYHSMTSKRPDVATLRRLYEEESFSTKKIANLYEVGSTTVSRWLHESGIQTRGIPEGLKTPGSALAKQPDFETLRRQYEDERLGVRKIAEIYQVGQSTVLRWLSAYDIPKRPSIRTLLGRGIEPPDRDTLYRLVHVEHRSYEEIGNIYGATGVIIPPLLDKYGIPRAKAWDTFRKQYGPTPPDAVTLRMLYEAGATLAEISELYGVCIFTVAKWCEGHGIERRETGWNYNKGQRYVCVDGNKVRSSYEMRVANWLHGHGIAYVYEPRLPFSNVFRGDFLANGWYIEVWGMTGDPKYDERKKRKTEGYKSHGTPLIELNRCNFWTKQAGTLEKRLSRCFASPTTEK